MLDILLDGYVRFSHYDSSTIIVVYDYVTYYILPIALVSTQESLLCSVSFYFEQLCLSTQKLTVIPFFGSYFC